ncbi:MAG: DUF4292 domain-containing protein [Saprospiraceae bacterium]|nr:DUF4292 domain-containing protein [Saprospiraceae bacterium]MCF8251243.1 DUF4292 domain-containing protein [Saprospiraceae bacterium]MCF8282990.1 DUF4292 domain-containing protein [Bacteroidales bacterium]MCF8313133.1 DUF4292 domain-containing protein [Saprospiraceae bacterium]MCF8441605.1 DUF4292 domain-containing protein [Saprospiraceae bacterium]
MKSITHFLLSLLVLALLAFSSCKAFRKAHGEAVKPKSEKALIKGLLENSVSAEWLGAKARISYSDEYGGESFSANIRMRKDSAIWMNFKKFSIEGARVLLTPDSIFVIDRINGEYTAKPFEYAQKEYSLPFGFQGLQALLLGNPVFFSKETTAGVDSTQYTLAQKTESLNATYWLSSPELLLRHFLVDDFRNKRTVDAFSSDFRPLGGKQQFSYVRSFNLKSTDLGKMKVQIEFSKVEINTPQEMKFEVPRGYKRTD